MTATVQCSLCRVAVPADKIDMANRCGDPRCPLNTAALNEQLAQAHQRATGRAS